MSDFVDVDPVAVRVGANQVATAAQDAVANLRRHHRQLADAADGWVGASRAALDELTERWEQQHASWQKAIGETVDNMTANARGFDDTESRNAHRLGGSGDKS